MEAKVHEELLSLLAQHSLEETVSNIDDIVLSYLVGVVELVSQGDDGLDIVELMEMMNAYLPGFDQINRSEIIDWMFGLAKKLINSSEVSHEPGWNELLPSMTSDKIDKLLDADCKFTGKKFPTYDYSEGSGNQNWNGICSSDANGLIQKEDKYTPAKGDTDTNCNKNSSPTAIISQSPTKQSPLSTFPLLSLPECQNEQSRSKRKGRQHSCSSQDSQDDVSKTDSTTIEEAQVRILLELFPSACTMEARHCLQLSSGNMDRAAQLIMDRQDTGQAIKSQTKVKVTKKSHKVKKTVECKLDDDIIKSCVLEKYSFIDTEEDKKTHRPPPPKGEAKKLVRYRDNQVVSMKGERFSEVKKKDDDEMKDTYVSLKPARKYRFH
uniref:CUE domain-containing protein n=1 Tax=Arion vulgaris TaxID=1028688 RepID=A0A0B6YBQ7_9EUPU